MSKQFSSESLQPGLVIKTHSGFFTVRPDSDPSRRIVCQLRGAMKQSTKKTELCVLGDRVQFELLPDGTGAIKTVKSRSHVLSRSDPGIATEQIIAANVDQVILVCATANPFPNPRNFDRVLVAAEKAEIPSIVIVVNKLDLAEAELQDAVRELFNIYEKIGYTVLYASAEQQIGIELLREQLGGKISVFTGQSGVGKSSLLNAIQKDLGLKVGAVSQKLSKGKHTTVNAEFVELELKGGGYVADTPGIRSLSLWDVEPSELDAYYPEFRRYVTDCQFSDCSHNDEPGCAVQAAVERGDVSAERLDSYQRLREQLESEVAY